MHTDSMESPEKQKGILHRGVSVYYFGSMLFVAGIALLALGSAFVILYQLHYKSEPEQILQTVLFMGAGIVIVLMGINFMIRQTKKGYVIVCVGALLSVGALVLFFLRYPDHWIYPVVSYVLSLYVLGFLVLLGNAFANVTLWIIDQKSVVPIRETGVPPKIYTDEEILRDIEEATRKRLEAAADELQFEIDSTSGFRFGRFAAKFRGHVTRTKDDMIEARSLTQTINPGETEKWGSVGIDKASSQLANTILSKTSAKTTRHRFFSRFRRKTNLKNEED